MVTFRALLITFVQLMYQFEQSSTGARVFPRACLFLIKSWHDYHGNGLQRLRVPIAWKLFTSTTVRRLCWIYNRCRNSGSRRPEKCFAFLASIPFLSYHSGEAFAGEVHVERTNRVGLLGRPRNVGSRRLFFLSGLWTVIRGHPVRAIRDRPLSFGQAHVRDHRYSRGQ